MAYIYFDYAEQTGQQPVLVLSSLVKQLASQVPYLPTGVEKLYKKFGSNKPSIGDLYDVLLEVSRSFDSTFIIFNALDECGKSSDQRKEYLSLIQLLARDDIDVLLTSRPHPKDIQHALRDATRIELLATEEGIANYICEKIDKYLWASNLIEVGRCKERITSELAKCVLKECMFKFDPPPMNGY